MLDEKEYRKLSGLAFQKVERAFEAVDPDIAECEFSQGALSIQFSDGSKCILSTQPSVRQIWVAVASKGVAHHFSYDPEKNVWLDDKGKSLELLSFIKSTIFEVSGIELPL